MNIRDDEIHLWLARDPEIRDPDLLARYAAALSGPERERRERFRSEKRGHQYLVSRALLRATLSLYVAEIAPAQWRFEENEYGKPRIANRTRAAPPRFNLSHSEEMVVLAVAREREVGVDVEWLRRSGDTVELADRFFSNDEAKALRALPAREQRGRFFDLWTLKEAYIKACGMGLSIPLHQFSYSFPHPGEVAIAFDPRRGDRAEHWHFWQIQPDEVHEVAVALNDPRSGGRYSLSVRETVPMRRVREVGAPILRCCPADRPPS